MPLWNPPLYPCIIKPLGRHSVVTFPLIGVKLQGQHMPYMGTSWLSAPGYIPPLPTPTYVSAVIYPDTTTHQGNAPVRTVTGCISILGMYFQNTSETHPLLPRRYTNSSQTWEINHGVGHSL